MSTTEAISGEPQGTKLLLPFRFAPRKTKHATVQRRELLRHMSEASLLKQMLIVRGPAGSGKSTLLMQWRGVCIQMNRPIAWLTVDAADRDPKQFNAGVAEALDKAQCPQIAEGFREVAAEADRLSSIQIAHRLASICNASNERPVFLLDQYERMDGPAAGEIISGFLDHALHARVVIGSRIRPNIPLGQLLASDQLFEIGPSDLNFTPFETREIFDGNVPELYTRRLHWETSGEAVAVGFARRAVDELPRDMVGTENWHEQLHHYYRAEILDLVTPEIRAAMARLVVVERFDLSLAHALIGRSATEVVEQLHHIDGLVLRHRGTQEFYFSEMLRRFLERQLAWLEDDELIELHRRAADWFETRQRISEALRHAVAARDKQMAARLLERIGYGSLVTEQGVSAAHDLLDLIGGLSDEHMPATLLSQVLIHAHEGDMAQASAKFRAVNSLLPSDSAMDTAVENQRILAVTYITAFQD